MEESEVDFAVHRRAVRAASKLLDECREQIADDENSSLLLEGARSEQLCASLWRKSCPGGTIAMK